MKTRRLVLLLLAVTVSKTLGAAILDEPVEYIAIEDPGFVDGQIPDYIDEVIRIKRSGSGDFFGFIKKGITSKLSQIAQASAGASAHFSKGSSGGSGGGYHYDRPHDVPSSYEYKAFDFWGLKKSIFNTLIQAVKAIKGGVIAIKGQLIKGGGAIIAAKGNIISMKGEAISNLGRHIITSAHLSPSAHSSHHVADYSAPSAPSGPEVSIHPSTSYGAPPKPEYGAPSAASGPSGGFADHPSSSGYGAPPSGSYSAPAAPTFEAPADSYGPPSAPSQPYLPQKLNSAYAALTSKIPLGAEAGIVILKKITGLGSGHAGVATLPLQDERNKVVGVIPNHVDVHPPADVSKPGLPQLFTPLSSDTKPLKSPPVPPTSKPDPYFESTFSNIAPPKPVYGSPVDAPPPSGFSAPSAPPAGSPVFHNPNVHAAPTIDESLLNGPSHNGILNKPFANYYLGEKPPKEIHNNFAIPGNFNSKLPSPFEINSFNADLPFGLGAFNNVHSAQHSFPGSIQNEFSGPIGNYAPSFNPPSGTDSYPVSSNLQYKHGLLEHKGNQPEVEIVKSIEYGLPPYKRH